MNSVDLFGHFVQRLCKKLAPQIRPCKSDKDGCPLKIHLIINAYNVLPAMLLFGTRLAATSTTGTLERSFE
jgi:hypothetical protein